MLATNNLCVNVQSTVAYFGVLETWRQPTKFRRKSNNSWLRYWWFAKFSWLVFNGWRLYSSAFFSELGNQLHQVWRGIDLSAIIALHVWHFRSSDVLHRVAYATLICTFYCFILNQSASNVENRDQISDFFTRCKIKGGMGAMSEKDF